MAAFREELQKELALGIREFQGKPVVDIRDALQKRMIQVVVRYAQEFAGTPRVKVRVIAPGDPTKVELRFEFEEPRMTFPFRAEEQPIPPPETPWDAAREEFGDGEETHE